MANSPAVVAEQFDEMSQQVEASSLGMWAFLATEILFFGGLFLSYIVYRETYSVAFAQAARHTNLLDGTVNTSLLLTSSLAMSFAIHSARLGLRRPLLGWLLLTMFLGCCFLAVKGLEYKSDIAEHLVPGKHFAQGMPPQSQLFWFLYWMMTGVHSLHLLVGLGVLGVIACMAKGGKFSEQYHTPVVISGLYWHFVDVIWVWLYALLYLVNRH